MGSARALTIYKMLVAAGVLLAASGSAFAANWVNPHTGMGFAPMVTILPGTSNTSTSTTTLAGSPATVNLCTVAANCVNGGLTAIGAAVVTPTITAIATTTTTTSSTTTVSKTVSANGSITTTTSTPTTTIALKTTNSTTTSAASNITVSPTFTFTFYRSVGSTTFTFVNLSSGPVTKTVCVGAGCTITGYPDTKFTFTATPAAGGTVTIVATAVGQNCDGSCPPQSSTLTLNVPLPTSTATTTSPLTSTTNIATNSTSTPGVDPPLTANAPVKGPQPVVEGVAALIAPDAQDAIAKCGIQVPNCVADALDAYANHLEQIAATLPPSMRKLPQIFHEAARKVRAAKTPAAAMRAITTALAQVKASITLIRAVDADTRTLGQTVGAESIDVLQSAQVALARVSGL